MTNNHSLTTAHFDRAIDLIERMKVDALAYEEEARAAEPTCTFADGVDLMLEFIGENIAPEDIDHAMILIRNIDMS